MKNDARYENEMSREEEMMSKRWCEKDVGNENEGVEEEKDEVNDLFTQLCGEFSQSFTRKNS